MGHGQPHTLWQPESGSERGVHAQPRAAGGEGSAHLAHRGAQAPSDLHAVVLHQEGRDVLPVVALRHLDSGDGGKSGLLRNREAGFSPTAPGDPGTLPGQSITEGGDFSLASKAAQAHLQLRRAVSSCCPYSVVVVGLSCTHLLLHKELKPHGQQPLAQPGAVGPVSLPRVLQTLWAESREKVSAAARISWHPRSLQAPRALLVFPCQSAATHPFCQHGQAFPQAEEAVDGRCVVVPAKLKGTDRGSAWLQHSSPLLMVRETEAQHPPSSSPSAESCDRQPG